MAEIRIKNVATTFAFPLIDAITYDYYTTSAWSNLTSATIQAYSWNDSHALSAHTITSTPTRVGKLWQLPLTQAEMNPNSGNDTYMSITLDAEEIEAQTILIQLTPEDINSDIVSIKSKTSAIPLDPASNTVVYTRLATSAYTAPSNSDISLIRTYTSAIPVDIMTIKSKTSAIPLDPASNTVVYTRLATSAYTAPSNSDITAIKAKTDLLSFSGTNVNSRVANEGVLNNITVADILAGVVDTKTVSEILEVLLAYVNGNISVNSNVFTYYKQNNSTVAFTLTGTSATRTRS